ncbi:MAG TPA: hypothetical protein VFY93_06995 [Planctomycetota bacterium]|nr:hypothetical protein [Planctomycetota bacterium]
MTIIARVLAIGGLLIVLATGTFLSLDRHPTHGTGVVGALTFIFAGGLTGLAVTCLLLDRIRRKRPSVGADAGAMLAFLLMLVATPVVCWLVVVMLEEIRLAAH